MHKFIFTKNLLSCIFGLGKKDLDIVALFFQFSSDGKEILVNLSDLQVWREKNTNAIFLAKQKRILLLYCIAVRNAISTSLTGQKKECKKSFITKKCNKRHKLHLNNHSIGKCFDLKINVPDLQGIKYPFFT